MSADKSKPPTEHRLRKAREDDGEVAASHDLAGAVALLFGLLALAFGAGTLGQHLVLVLLQALDTHAARDYNVLQVRLRELATEALLLTVPFALAAALGGALGTAIQDGLTTSTKKLQPKIQILNPVEGLKKLFSVRSLIEGIKVLLKLAVLGSMLFVAVKASLRLVIGVAGREPWHLSQLLWAGLQQFVLVLAVTMLIFGVIDYRVQAWLFKRDKRMSEDEIKREGKEQNGNPEIKSKRRELANEAAAEMPQKPSVMVTNPTHYCVALSHRHAGAAQMPIVLEKGRDGDALAMRQRALAMGIPVVERPALARRLYLVQLGEPVPPDTYQAVALVLQWVGSIHTPQGPGR